MTTPDQLRAGRAILGLSQAEVASLTGKTTKTIRRAETDAAAVAVETIASIRAALESAGVEFIAENGGGAGVRLRKA
ncbi:helix-turn-helix transcriptional regulator [Salipiger sp. 1_MG-2023]|uniref:helix-turn-helix domain-containing protein n=1 Tax=Salipiger sp. 1_MG-2023 TaxID=3062665 RepID=UPI0026E2D398|nr:helix-turn-helix transcriptional regulator [Salipiger sp. 1_MG-2023]MDO6588504.1 helix-turn-helix transcriptional regulator [Salipiger sp. 1_MG-2023]